MSDTDFVTIARFWEPSEPLFLKSMLEAYGIEARLQGEYAGNLTPFLGIFGGKPQGGVELQVPAEDVEEATELLNNPPGEAEESVVE